MPSFCNCGFDDLVQEEVPARLHPGIIVTVSPHPANSKSDSNNSDLPCKGYSEAFPPELEGAIEKQLYGEIIAEINTFIKTGDDGGLACLACLFMPVTACGSFCVLLHYETKWENRFVDLLKKSSEREGVKPRLEFFLGAKVAEHAETGTKKYHPLKVPPREPFPAAAPPRSPGHSSPQVIAKSEGGASDEPPPPYPGAPPVARTRSGKQIVAATAAWATGVVITGMPVATPVSPQSQSMQRGGDTAPAVVVQGEVIA